MSNLTLFIANKNYSSWSLRPWLLLGGLGIEFQERLHWFGGDTPFASFSPTGQVPCLHHDGMVIWDSLAIAEYLAELHPTMWPSDPVARAWARSATAEMHGGFLAVRAQCSMNCGVRVRLHRIDDGLQSDLDRLDALWTEGLQRFGGPFLAGSTLTVVDAFYAPVVFRLQTYGIELSKASMEYAATMRALPAMQRWYRDALAETVRDEPHDADLATWGEVIEDLRAR